MLGRLVRHKRVEHVLETAVRLQARWPKLRVAVVGDGWWARELRDRARQLGLDDVVEFLGYVDEQHKHEELARAWLLAAPSIKEGWGLGVVKPPPTRRRRWVTAMRAAVGVRRRREDRCARG